MHFNITIAIFIIIIAIFNITIAIFIIIVDPSCLVDDDVRRPEVLDIVFLDEDETENMIFQILD